MGHPVQESERKNGGAIGSTQIKECTRTYVESRRQSLTKAHEQNIIVVGVERIFRVDCTVRCVRTSRQQRAFHPSDGDTGSVQESKMKAWGAIGSAQDNESERMGSF